MTNGDGWEAEAIRDAAGNVIVAHLCRKDKDFWDTIVVSKSMLPLVGWAPADHYKDIDRAIISDNLIKMVVMSTPPGVQPSGFTVVPADSWDSPLWKIVAVVTADNHTQIDADGPTQGEKESVDSLIRRVVWRDREGYGIVELQTANGDATSVLVDWDGRPIMYWTDDPPESGQRVLQVIAVLSSALVPIGIDRELRPLASTQELEIYYDKTLP